MHNSVTLRARDLNRKSRSNLEKLFKERLASEGIPIYMSPPLRKVPGLLIRMRKPDGVAPDPETGEPPEVYLEIKNIRRVADDIQKRLYEIAEVSLEMKLLYGGLQLSGFTVKSTHDFDELAPEIRASLRSQIQKARPVVVAFFLCPRDEAERYRPGAEAFIDRVFFQEEVEECLACQGDLLPTTESHMTGAGESNLSHGPPDRQSELERLQGTWRRGESGCSIRIEGPNLREMCGP